MWKKKKEKEKKQEDKLDTIAKKYEWTPLWVQL